LQSYQAILKGEAISAVPTAAQTALLLSGLVATINGVLQVKNKIYLEVFNQAWLLLHLQTFHPDPERMISLPPEIEQLLGQNCDLTQWLREAILEKLHREGLLPEEYRFMLQHHWISPTFLSDRDRLR
jgi:hypothetical protein